MASEVQNKAHSPFLPDTNSSEYLLFSHFALFTLVVDEDKKIGNKNNISKIKS